MRTMVAKFNGRCKVCGASLRAGEPETRGWIARCLGYFRNCYRSLDPEDEKAGTEWHAGNLHIVRDGDHARSIDDHAGVHHVRKFYPEFVPTTADWDGACWGKRKENVLS